MHSPTRRSFLKISGGILGGIAAGTTVTAATNADRYIVRAKPNHDLDGVNIVHDLREEIGHAVVSGDASTLESRKVDYVEDTQYKLDRPVAEAAVPDDAAETRDEPFYALQWDKEATNVPDAHDITRGDGARIAVIDSGVAAGHPDLSHAVNTTLSRDFTGDGYGAGGPFGGDHGTHVAGIIAANDQNDQGTVGTAPGAEIVDCRVFSPGELASFGDIIAAMVYSAAVGCDAANLSLGAYPIPRQGLGSFYGKVLNRVTAYTRKEGTLLVVAAGNSGADLQHDKSVISLPNEAANVVSVSATGPIGYLWGDPGLESDFSSPAFYTNYGTNAIDVSAPGGDADLDAIGTGVDWYLDLVFNTISQPVFDDDGTFLGANHSYGWKAGTSMAAPQVAGVAGLVAAANPRYNANKLRNAILGGAQDMDDNAFHGRGFLDAHGALQ